MRQALKHESNGTTWQTTLLSCLFDGELLFVNTRLSVKVKLSAFNLVKAIQSCREEVKIWSENFWAYKCNTCSYCHYAFKPRRKQSQGTQQRHLFNFCFALKCTRSGVGNWWDRKIIELHRFHLTFISSSGTFLQILLKKVATVTRYDDTEPWQFWKSYCRVLPTVLREKQSILVLMKIPTWQCIKFVLWLRVRAILLSSKRLHY